MAEHYQRSKDSVVSIERKKFLNKYQSLIKTVSHGDYVDCEV